MTPRHFARPRRIVAAALASVTLTTAALVACHGNGHATVNAPTPLGPVLVDLWWCEKDQCITATDPADTPTDVPMIARGVDLTLSPNLKPSPN